MSSRHHHHHPSLVVFATLVLSLWLGVLCSSCHAIRGADGGRMGIAHGRRGGGGGRPRGRRTLSGSKKECKKLKKDGKKEGKKDNGKKEAKKDGGPPPPPPGGPKMGDHYDEEDEEFDWDDEDDDEEVAVADNPPRPPSIGVNLDWCPETTLRRADCDALASGKLPDGQSLFSGVLDLDITYTDGNARDVQNRVAVILRSETISRFAGCYHPERRRRRRRLSQSPEQPPQSRRDLAERDYDVGEDDFTIVNIDDLENEHDYEILGAKFGNMVLSDGLDCKNVRSGVRLCRATMESDVNVYYDSPSRNLTVYQRLEILDRLETTIVDQVGEGSFEGVGDVDDVDVRLKDGSSANAAAAASGAAVGALFLLLCLGGGGYYYYTRHYRPGGNDGRTTSASATAGTAMSINANRGDLHKDYGSDQGTDEASHDNNDNNLVGKAHAAFANMGEKYRAAMSGGKRDPAVLARADDDDDDVIMTTCVARAVPTNDDDSMSNGCAVVEAKPI